MRILLLHSRDINCIPMLPASMAVKFISEDAAPASFLTCSRSKFALGGRTIDADIVAGMIVRANIKGPLPPNKMINKPLVSNMIKVAEIIF